MHLEQPDRDRLTSFYRAALNRFGDNDARSVHWSDETNQVRRLGVLLQVDDLSDKSILDVGCGLGHLYKMLLSREIPVDYTGIDIVPEFVETAQKKFPDAHFIEKDVFDVHESFDVVLASGALSFKVKDNDNHYKEMIKKMYNLARTAVAFNMLDKTTHIDNDTYAAYSPKEIADFCSTFATHVEITTDYLPQDFTVYLYK